MIAERATEAVFVTVSSGTGHWFRPGGVREDARDDDRDDHHGQHQPAGTAKTAMKASARATSAMPDSLRSGAAHADRHQALQQVVEGEGSGGEGEDLERVGGPGQHDGPTPDENVSESLSQMLMRRLLQIARRGQRVGHGRRELAERGGNDQRHAEPGRRDTHHGNQAVVVVLAVQGVHHGQRQGDERDID